MGRMYTAVEVSVNNKKKITVGLIDTGADETIVSEKLAVELSASLYGEYKAVCASGFKIKGKYSNFSIKEFSSGKTISLKAGVSDVPFDTDDINDEGLNIILGIDFIQETGLELI